MARKPDMDPMLAAAMFGFQQSGGVAGGVALALVMTRRSTYVPPTGAELKHALKVAERFKLSADLAPFLPPEPRWFWSRKDKNAYRSAIISLKQLDALPGDERESAIADLKALLGASVS